MPPSVDQALAKARRHAKRGEADRAAEIYRGVLERYPQNRKAREGLEALGPSQAQMDALITLYTLQEYEEALAQGQDLARQFPNVPFIPNVLGAVNAGLGRAEAAAACYRDAISLNPDYAEAHGNLADTLNSLGRPEEAIASAMKALEIEPTFAEAHNNLGNALYLVGKVAEATASYERALELMPDYGEAHRNLSTVKRYREGDPQIPAMQALIDRADLSNRNRMNLSFALGKARDDLGDRDAAFLFFCDGNRLRKLELGYDISYDVERFAAIRSAFAGEVPGMGASGEAEARAARSGETGSAGAKVPVFVLGMPRSGTTLVEQILASHSRVHAAGELGLLGQSVSASGWQSTGLAGEVLRSVRDAYFSGLGRIGTSERYVVDKMPANFLWIGFICATMPEAKIVHVMRDARATCWSNFKHYFSSTGNGFANDLVDVAKYYRLYTDLMSFWNERFPGRIYELRYETLTESQEAETRRLLEHVGLEWEAECLEFHRTERVVPTASATQVRQAMYQGSSDAWREYENHLAPMLELLRDL